MTPAAVSVLTVSALGAAAGVVFAWLWLWIVPWGVHRRFWAGMSSVTRDLMQVEDMRRFGSLYGSLLALVARYVGRNLAGTVIAGLPIAALLLMAWHLLREDEILFFVVFALAMTAVFVWPGARRS